MSEQRGHFRIHSLAVALHRQRLHPRLVRYYHSAFNVHPDRCERVRLFSSNGSVVIQTALSSIGFRSFLHDRHHVYGSRERSCPQYRHVVKHIDQTSVQSAARIRRIIQKYFVTRQHMREATALASACHQIRLESNGLMFITCNTSFRTQQTVTAFVRAHVASSFRKFSNARYVET